MQALRIDASKGLLDPPVHVNQVISDRYQFPQCDDDEADLTPQRSSGRTHGRSKRPGRSEDDRRNMRDLSKMLGVIDMAERLCHGSNSDVRE